MGSYQEDTAESKRQGTNPWEGDCHRKENRTKHWEGVTVSYRRRSIAKERYYTTNMNLNQGDIGAHRRRNKEEKQEGGQYIKQ